MVARTIEIKSRSDGSLARRIAKDVAESLGFPDRVREEISLVASELAANIVVHADHGTLSFQEVLEGARAGLRIVASDHGPGIADVDRALMDGFSTAGSLGYGLGSINRLADEMTIHTERGSGTTVECTIWRRVESPSPSLSKLDVAVSSRPHPGMTHNGDSFVIKKWGDQLLVAVMDGLGHGAFAHRAASSARAYVERHFDLAPEALFRRTGAACRATRGLVMSIARFDLRAEQLEFSGIGNVEGRLYRSSVKKSLITRRGIIGGSAPKPLVITGPFAVDTEILVMFTDGITSHWDKDEVTALLDQPAERIARHLLLRYGKDTDDATVAVVKAKGLPMEQGEAS